MTDPNKKFSETEVITPEITALREAVAAGQSLFVCGRAGVGKSRQLMWARAFADEPVWSGANNSGKRTQGAVCLAPTGVAATNVGGQTIH